MKLGDLDSGEITKMAIEDDSLRMFKTPFGKDGGTYVVGKNVPWAGLKGFDAIENSTENGDKIVEGLKKARKISKEVEAEGNNKGVAVVKYGDRKGTYTMPKHAYLMMKKQGKNVSLVKEHASVGGSPGYAESPAYATDESRAQGYS